MSQNEQRWDDLAPLGPFAPRDVIRDLGEGLILRSATPADVQALMDFNRAVHADPPHFQPAQHVALWARDLLGDAHPRVGPRDFTLVEDTKSRRIASTLCLISHRFAYDGLEFDAGQPELVGTHPDFRRRRLVSKQFEVIHRWSAARGHKLQLIDGIPWYYRQYGYEMALENAASRVAHRAHLPEQAPPGDLRVRAATGSDAPLLLAGFHSADRRHVLSCVRDEAFCRYELTQRDPGSAQRREVKIVENATGDALAVFAHLPVLWQGFLNVSLLELCASASWQSITPHVLYALGRQGEACASGDGASFRGVGFYLGTEHPLYSVAPARLPEVRRPYAYYLRVPDVADFLRYIGPALEQRLEESALAGYSGRIAISFYRTGVRLILEAGKLTGVEPWSPSTEERGHVAFPDLTFLQLLFGYRSLDDLLGAFPDCMVWSDTRGAVLRALFPKRGSNLAPTL